MRTVKPTAGGKPLHLISASRWAVCTIKIHSANEVVGVGAACVPFVLFVSRVLLLLLRGLVIARNKAL